MSRAVRDRDGVGSFAHLQHHIHEQRAVGIECDSGAAVRFESGVVHFENIVADGKDRESISTSAVGGSGLPDARAGVDQSDGRFRNRRTRRVLDSARDAPAHPSPGRRQQAKGQAQAAQRYFAETSHGVYERARSRATKQINTSCKSVASEHMMKAR